VAFSFDLEGLLLAVAVAALAALFTALVWTRRRAQRAIQREATERNVELERANRQLRDENRRGARRSRRSCGARKRS
jgi:type II secretory pathway pseudopilin PulG